LSLIGGVQLLPPEHAQTLAKPSPLPLTADGEFRPLPPLAPVPDVEVTGEIPSDRIANEDTPSSDGEPDRPALAVTAPAVDSLATWPVSGQVIRLRMYIDESGKVTDVDILECASEDRTFAAALAAILRHTPYIPARAHGQDVSSTKDIVLQFNVPLPIHPPHTP
jgi:hypothetical protein